MLIPFTLETSKIAIGSSLVNPINIANNEAIVATINGDTHATNLFFIKYDIAKPTLLYATATKEQCKIITPMYNNGDFLAITS